MRKDKRNQGFTLVELIVSIAIFAIIMTTVAGVLSAMSKMFSSAQKDIELQDSVQTTFSLLSDLVKESQVVTAKGHENSVKVVDGDLYIYKESIDQDASTYTTKVASTDATLYVAHLDKNSKNLYLYQTKYDPTALTSGGTFTDVAVTTADICKAENLLSKNVTTFSVKDEAANGYIVLDIQLEYGSRNASIAQNVYLRNSNTTIWASDMNESTEEVSTTPTPTPTTAAIVASKEIIKGTETYTTDKSTITSDSNVGVYYGFYEDRTAEKISTTSTVYRCNSNNCTETQIDTTSNPYWIHCSNCNTGLSYDTSKTEEENLAILVSQNKVIKENVTTYSYPTTNRIIIRNESLTSDLSSVVVVVYMQNNGAYFTKLSNGAFLKTDTALTTGGIQTKYETSALVSGQKCKYIKIMIPTLKKAETYTENGEDKVKYDQYVYTFDYAGTSGKPVICTYSVKTN